MVPQEFPLLSLSHYRHCCILTHWEFLGSTAEEMEWSAKYWNQQNLYAGIVSDLFICI